jgi:uncharacterized metal-binding protein
MELWRSADGVHGGVELWSSVNVYAWRYEAVELCRRVDMEAWRPGGQQMCVMEAKRSRALQTCMRRGMEVWSSADG